MNAISVLTCAARGHYLAQTIASIDRAGGDTFDGPKTIHVDGPADQVPLFLGWHVTPVAIPRAGARLAMESIMKRHANAGVETLLYFEDDVILCRNSIRAMLEIGVPQPLGFVSYCDLLWHNVPPLELRAFPGCPKNYPVADGGFVGCQALAIPLRTLERFWQPLPQWIDRNNCDATMGTIADVYGIVDSLAEHVGAESCIMGTRYERLRAVRGWRGEDFDADAVPRVFVEQLLGERCPFHAGVLHPNGRPCRSTSATHRNYKAPPCRP